MSRSKALAMAVVFGAMLASTTLADEGSQGHLKPFDDLMAEFVKTHEVPGAALAITKDSRLVYAKGFGFADREKQRPVEPHFLFRIASVSKPITATAVMQLVEKGKLELDARVLEILEYEPHLAPDTKPDPRLKDITVRHLLLHSAGWDRGVTFSVMGIGGARRIATALGVPQPPTQTDIIRFMIGKPLQFSPGERSAYSNFGYVLLGRVIEAVTGQTYEDYVKQNVLAPLGIKTMQIGRTAKEQLAPNEVHYGRDREIVAPFGPRKGERVKVPYARCVENMDANGGWIASAIDLARFAASFDDPASCPILQEKSIEAMFVRPEGRPGLDKKGRPRRRYYALGWNVSPNEAGGITTSHGGGMEGTSTSLVRRHDGINWVILFNAHGSPHARGSLSGLIGKRLHKTADGITKWPDDDLF
ncbi:serine hydrolase domain-containing protein [Planctomycetota bacterium]